MTGGRGRQLASLAALAWVLAAGAAAAAAPLGVDQVLPHAATGTAPPAPSLPSAAPLTSTAPPAPRGPDALGLLADALGRAGGALGSALGAAMGSLGSLGGALLGALVLAARAVAGALLALGGAAGAALGWWAGSMARSPRNVGSLALGGLGYALHARGVLAPLFSRLERHELLDNEARQRIFAYVQQRPGAHLSEIAGAMRLGWGTTVYHLGRLVDGQLLTSRKVGNQLCHFVNGEGRTAQEQTRLAATKTPKAHAIVQLLALRGPSSQSVIARELGMSGALVSWHAKRLEELGVVQRARQGRLSVLTLAGPPPPARPARTAQPAQAARAPEPAREPMPVAA